MASSPQTCARSAGESHYRSLLSPFFSPKVSESLGGRDIVQLFSPEGLNFRDSSGGDWMISIQTVADKADRMFVKIYNYKEKTVNTLLVQTDAASKGKYSLSMRGRNFSEAEDTHNMGKFIQTTNPMDDFMEFAKALRCKEEVIEKAIREDLNALYEEMKKEVATKMEYLA